jgi:hypothetical protein
MQHPRSPLPSYHLPKHLLHRHSRHSPSTHPLDHWTMATPPLLPKTRLMAINSGANDLLLKWYVRIWKNTLMIMIWIKKFWYRQQPPRQQLPRHHRQHHTVIFRRPMILPPTHLQLPIRAYVDIPNPFAWWLVKQAKSISAANADSNDPHYQYPPPRHLQHPHYHLPKVEDEPPPLYRPPQPPFRLLRLTLI